MSEWLIRDYAVINEGETLRISASIFEGETRKELWYRVPSFVKDSLFANCLDPFLVAVLPFAMMSGSDLHIAGCVSEKLYNSILDSIIPLMANNTGIYNNIYISADEIVTYPSSKGHVGTGLSCGVGSFNTILSLMQEDPQNQLDTLTFFNVGSHRSTSGFSDKESRKLFETRLKKNSRCAQEMGMPLLVIDSNIGQYINEHKVKYVSVHAFCSASAVLACGSYFNRYYYSSSEGAVAYDPKKCIKSTGFIELTLCPWLSTEYTEISSYGYTKTRLEKVRAIADSPLVQKYLDVCWREASNCGKCPKCVRTLMELYVLGNVNQFNKVFDVKDFYDHFEEHKEYIYSKSDNLFCKEIIEELEKMPGEKYAAPSFFRKGFLNSSRADKEVKEQEKDPQRVCKVYSYQIDNAGDLFNNDLLEFFSVDLEKVGIAAHADLLMLGGILSSLQNPDRPMDDAPLHVWGTGFLFGDDNHFPLCRPNLVVKALRGRLSKDKLSHLLGKSLPEDLPLADPGLLASYFTSPNIEKEYAMGFILHFREQGTDEVERVFRANPDMLFIDITKSPKEVIREIQRCETIVSSSLHGLVFSDSIGVPNVHTRLTELPKGGSFKFRDYYSSFGLEDPALTADDICGIRPEEIRNNYCIERRMVEEKKRQLIESFPKVFCR